jgi:hypothetical protein
MTEESCLEDVKKKYAEFQMKYGLPDFKKLNEDFQIEKVAETETEVLLKEVRRFMFDKFSNYMRFLESLLNPVNASVFTFSVLKTLNADDKKIVEEIYKKLMRLEVDLMEIDIEYVEEKEAAFIKTSSEIWDEIKIDWIKIVNCIQNNWDNKVEKKEGKDYFG